jgi:uncharacterized membrane protein YhiD involved in acid resistance
MGVAFGLGYYVVGGSIFFGIVVVQFGLPRVVALVEARGPRRREIEVRIECSEDALESVNRAWRDFAAKRQIFALRHSTRRQAGAVIWRAIFVAIAEQGLDLTTIEESLVSVDGIVSIDARQTVPGDEIP